MGSTTDFETWLADNAPENVEEAFDLVRAADGKSEGVYDVSIKGETVIIKGRGDNSSLVLASPSVRSAFKKRLEAYKNDSDLDWDGAVELYRGMQKPD
jgi:hypothetical protein